MYLPTFIIAFVFLTLLMSFVYFYMFGKGNQGTFIRFWGLCWIFYSLSLVFLFLYINDPRMLFMGFRKVFDLLNILFLLFGAYAFVHAEIPGYWYRFSLYMILWVTIGVVYRFDSLSNYLPVAAYQVIATGVLCLVVLRRWEVPPLEKTLSVVVFLLWGVGKAILSVFELEYYNVSNYYLLEIIFSNILNFSIFAIFLQKARSEITIAERLYRIIAENATDVIFYYSLEPQQAFTYITPSVEDMTGYAPGEFYANPKFYLQIVPSEQFEEITAVFQAETRPQGSYTKVFRIVPKNSIGIWAEFNVSTIYENGRPIAVEGFIRDITRMKNAESELLASRKSRELLLSYISHELKTPVTSIMGYVNALKDGTINESREISDAINIIFTKSLTLEHLINDLFQLSKLETRQFSFNFMHTEALELSKLLIGRHLLDIKTADLRLDYRIQQKALANVFLIADTERIDQVFSNLITNAIKYSEPKDKLTIRFGLDTKNDCYFVSVTDSGAGIGAEDLPFIFDRFYKATASTEKRNTSGTGLGLTISKEIITAHKGTITAKSQLGKGSTFTFAIPTYRE